MIDSENLLAWNDYECVCIIETDVVKMEIPTSTTEIYELISNDFDVAKELYARSSEEKRDVKYSYVDRG